MPNRDTDASLRSDARAHEMRPRYVLAIAAALILCVLAWWVA